MQQSQVITAKSHTTDALHCRVCGRPVHTKIGRGRTKEAHKSCVEFSARMNQLRSVLERMEFADHEHANALRGQLFRLANGPLQHRLAKINPDSDENI